MKKEVVRASAEFSHVPHSSDYCEFRDFRYERLDGRGETFAQIPKYMHLKTIFKN